MPPLGGVDSLEGGSGHEFSHGTVFDFRCGKAAREGKPARTVLATGFERLGSALITLL